MKKLSRAEAIKNILKLNKDSLIITSAGYTSRALYNLKDSPKHFYMQGSMGCALGFALGLSINTNKEVVVILGDGEILMSLSTLALTEYLLPTNLSIYVLDNNQYQSTGGQKTISEYIPRCGFNVWTIEIDDDYIPPRIPLKHEDIAERFYYEINGCKPIN
jgi:thiamine pyrophosphate-dependent acetolactate synthase large subunit-like protein